MDLDKYIRDVPDFPKPGIIFKDITPLLNNADAFKAAADLFAEQHRNDADKIDRVVGIESRGFIFAATLSHALHKPLVLARKPGKLPHDSIKEEYELEYGTNTLEMHKDAIKPGENVVVIDDLLATGGTMAATCALVEKLGGKIFCIGTLIELEFLKGREKLGDHPFYAFLKY